MPTVSVIIPTYNRRNYVPASIQSVLDQTYGDYEIVVVDDGSTDNTRELLERWIESGTIRYIRQENKGAAAASNRGFKEASGELITFLDSDDLWPEDKLEWQVQYLREHPEMGAVGGAHQFIDKDGEKSKSPIVREGEYAFENVFTGTPVVSIGAALIRCRLVDEAGGFDESIETQDFDLWMKLARRGCRIAIFPRVSLYYRVHGENCSLQNGLRQYEVCERVIRMNLPFVPARDRRRVTVRAFHWLFEYRGERAILDCKARIVKGDRSQLRRTLGLVIRLLPVAICDRRLFRRVCGTVLPARLILRSRRATTTR